MKYLYTYEVKNKIVIIALLVFMCVMFTPIIAWFVSCCVLILMPIAFCMGIKSVYNIFFN